MTYRILHKIIGINASWSVVIMPLFLLLTGCRDDKTVTAEQQIIQSVWASNHEDETSGMENVIVDTNVLSQPRTSGRIPDLSVRVRGGDALVLETDGMSLTALGGTVKHSGVYSVTALTEHELPPMPQGMVNMTATNGGYRLLPSGDHFDPPAELRVQYDPSLLPPGYTPDDIYTSFFDSTSMSWVRLERIGIDTAAREIVSLTTHFTDFVNELLKAPEMPETQAFVPTQISGLEAANPLSGYTTIAPPEANNMGTANLTYPFSIPAGRANMQPNIALTYNSGSGNGICGMGWDLTIPCISVETRWGVPLYDSDLETETYLYNGEQLLVSHESAPTFAKAPVPRNHNEYTKRYYPRVEGSFDSILRHGTTPQTYWWEVFDRQGNCYIYGLGDGELKAYGTHAIAKWYLTRVIDRNGNTTRYQYSKYEDSGSGLTSGTALYLDKIVYTAHNEGFMSQPWYGYCVQFYYGSRTDPVISGNYGLKENLCKRLDTVKTWFVKVEPVSKEDGNNLITSMPEIFNELKTFIVSVDDLLAIAARILNVDSYTFIDSSLIRGYRLLYDYSKTGKSLLAAVVEMNAQEWSGHPHDIEIGGLHDGTTLKYHRFNYRDIDSSVFGEVRTMSTKVHKAHSGLDEYYPSPLGGSREWKTGFNLNCAFGLDLNAWLRTFNLEVNGSISPKSTSHGTTALVDLNGDGYPDLLYRISKNDWRCQLYTPDSTNPSGTGSFGISLPVNMPTDEFSASVTRDNYSVGLGVHAGIEHYEYSGGLNVSGQKSFSKSDITTYFADVNSDGKVDIVKDGRVWFNNTDGDSVSFGTTLNVHPATTVVCDTGYYSLSGSFPLNDSIFDDGHVSYTTVFGGRTGLTPNIIQDTLVERRTDTTYRSAVRSWIARYEGKIHISGAARLDSMFLEAISRTNADGVHVSIQCNDSIIAGTSHDLDINNPSHVFSVVRSVKAGDRIYFRVEALKNDLYDVVEWDPLIFYTGKDTLEKDKANRKAYVFSAKDDFLAWQEDRFYMPMDGSVNIRADYSLSRQLTEDIELRILQLSSNDSILNKSSKIITAGNIVNPWDGTWKLDWEMDSSDVLTFEVLSTNEQDWAALKWVPHVVSQSFADTTIPNYVIMDNEQGGKDTVYTIDVYPSPSYQPNFEFTGWNNTLDTILGVFRSHYRGWGAFTYNSDTVRMPMDESLIRPDERSAVFAGMTVDNLDSSLAATIGDTTQPVSSDAIQTGLASYVPNTEDHGTGMMNATYDGDRINRIWTAGGYRSFISPTHIGLYNWQTVRTALNDTILLIPVTNRSVAAVSSGGGMAVGPVKGSGQEGYSVHASISAGIQDADDNLGFNGCVNYSHGDSWVNADFVDMNGDGYPDIIGRNDVQYTNSRGGLSDKRAGTAVSGENGIQNTVYNAMSLQGGSSYASYEKQGKARGKVCIEQRSKGSGLSQSKTLAMSFDKQPLSWMDINGDGLPDCINDSNVYLNLGYSYYNGVPMNGIRKTENTSTTSSTSGAIDFLTGTSLISTLSNTTVSSTNKSFSGGKTVSRSDNNSPVRYIDINGDGLADKLINDTLVYFNNGWGFDTNGYTLDCPAPSHGGGFNVDYNGNVTVGVPITILMLSLKFQGTLGGSISNSISTTESTLMDMNADGLPDIVSRTGKRGAFIAVKYNQLYDVDKLVSVESFYGNRMELTYSQAGYSSRSRQRPTVMSSLKVEDLIGAGEDSLFFTYNYLGHVYSATERTSFGFDSVVITQYLEGHPYRLTHRKYRTDIYKMRGLKASELLTDAIGRPYVKQVWNYELKRISDGMVVPPGLADCFGATWPALDSVFTIHYKHSDGSAKIWTAESYIHTDSGRIAGYVNLGDIAIPSDDIYCMVEYTRGRRNQSALPKEMTAADVQNNMLRHRAAKYNGIGLLTELVVYNDEEDSSSVFTYSFDEYGNPHSAEMPPNDSSQRAKYIYAYDTVTHQFLVSTTDSAFGLVSRAEYDVRLGVPLRIYSVGGDSISYSYDDWGRPLTIRAPQECDTAGYPTIRYCYWDGTQPAHPYHGGPLWALTSHHSQKDTALDVTTAVFTDGHGRVLQTRKSAVIGGQVGQVASGHVIYDNVGRPVKQYEPAEIWDTSLCVYIPTGDEGLYTLTEYDLLDRPVMTEIPSENIVTFNDYGFESVGGVNFFSHTVTDPENNSTTTLTDARGLTTQIIDAMQGVTRFEYDALGQLKRSSDPEFFMTSYSYDMQGHLAKRVHPDAGMTLYEYDPAGHLAREANPLGEISYHYTYGRLQQKCYGNMPGNNVTYHYYNNGHGAGQPDLVSDGSGVQRFEYDEMGRVSRCVRTLSVPGAGNAYTFTHRYEYDSWNRMWNMTYPDGERVDYRYNRAGDLVMMSGDKNGNLRSYINWVEYNKYGKRTKIGYGNDSHTEYAYDSLQRLTILHSVDKYNNVMQHIVYTFDRVGNIIMLQDTTNGVAGLGGGCTNYYTYDPLYRLVGADGDGTAGFQPCNFNINEMQYSASGRLGIKKIDWNSVTTHGQKYMEYGYSSTGYQPHAPNFIVNHTTGGLYDLLWDHAGNLIRLAIQNEPDAGYTIRHLRWTEDNRLHTVADERHFSYYTYDYSGERTLKMTGDAYDVDQNAREQYLFASLNNITIYPSPYTVVSNQGYTKHYYAGAERVAARLGGGGLGYDTACISQNPEVSRCADSLFRHVLKSVNSYEYQKQDSLDVVRIDGSVLGEASEFNGDNFPIRLNADVRAEPWRLNRIIEGLSDSVNPIVIDSSYEPDVYFYHSDHLGSASWITDAEGIPVQHLQYLPFGEPFVNQRISGYQERFTFTGKERDAETGYSYFGARYYDSDLSGLFLSVDPMADKYPSTSPHAYCAWNPIKIIDPDGMDTINGTYSKMLSKACSSSYPGMIILNGHGITPNDDMPSTNVKFENDRYTMFDGMLNMRAASTIELVAEFLSEYNDVYKKNTEQGLITIVVLITCRAGTELPIPYAHQDNIAQSIAKEMPNAIVIAPSWDVTLNKDNKVNNMYVYEDPYRHIKGHWNVYNNGRKIDRINNLNKLDALIQEAQNKTLLYRYLIPIKDNQ